MLSRESISGVFWFLTVYLALSNQMVLGLVSFGTATAILRLPKKVKNQIAEGKV
jgi:hypothetical protein